MSDDPNEPNNQPAEAPAPAATYSEADIARILEADRAERGAAPTGDNDPVAKFRASTHGTKLYAAKKPEAKPQPQSNSELSELVALAKAQVALQVAAMKPPTPPAPPKPMTAREKLTSADETIWLNRGSPNQWTRADRDQLVAEYASKLSAEGFKYDVGREAEARASKEIADAGMRALKNIKIATPGSTFDLSLLAGRK